MDGNDTSKTGFFKRIQDRIKRYTGGYYFSAFILLSILAFLIEIFTHIRDYLLYGSAALLALPCAIVFNRIASPEYKNRLSAMVERRRDSVEWKKHTYASRWFGLLFLCFGTTGMLIAHLLKKFFAIDGSGVFTLAILVALFGAVIISDEMANRRFENNNNKGEQK